MLPSMLSKIHANFYLIKHSEPKEIKKNWKRFFRNMYSFDSEINISATLSKIM